MKAQLLFERKLKVVRKEPLGYRPPTEVHGLSGKILGSFFSFIVFCIFAL